jgi:periplasmic protein TonB
MSKRTLIPTAAAAAAVVVLVAACGSPPPPPAPPVPETAPIVAPPPEVIPPAPSASPPAAVPGPRLAARDPALEQWKRRAAERIHGANSKQLFEGRPHHLLQGVIVVDVTVDKSGQVTRSKIVRSPGITRLDNVVRASLKAASPLPAPPAALAARGSVTYSETWLFTDDGRWRLRTLAMPQE